MKDSRTPGISFPSGVWPVTQADHVVDETVKLRPGRYVLYCSLADHRGRGMVATLVVRKAGT